MGKLQVIKKSIGPVLARRSPEIMTALGLGSLFGAIGFGIGATPKACELIEERKLDEGKDKLTPLEVVQTTWKCYIPMAVSAGVGTACIVGAAHKNYKRNTALAAAYGLAQESMQIYRDKVIETLGEKKEAEIREKADQERINRHPPQSFEVNPFPPDSLFEYEGRYFASTWENVRSAVLQLGEDMLSCSGEPEVTENDFFELVNLPYQRESSRKIWNLHLTGRPELYPPSCIELPNHQICFVLTFRNPPIDVDFARKKQGI